MIAVRRSRGVPKIADPAWHGPLGEAAQRLAPATEADPVAILVTSLSLFGAVAGDSAFVRVGGVRHPARIWPLIVGRTSAGRKGTAWAVAREFVSSFSSYTRTYCAARVVSGLSSGEGLITALSADEDAKAPDGRLTVLEPEFVRVLAATRREGNTLSPVLRSLWDDGNAAILTRHSPLSCGGAHVALVAHVTPRELRLKLAESDISGGTVNRLLPVLAERSQLLAHEPSMPDLSDLASRLGAASDAARGLTSYAVVRSKGADRLWTDAYAALNEDEPDGPLGAVMARGPAYTMRIALAYALADRQKRIETDHLLAALAVWQYAADSARLLFGDLSETTDLTRLSDFLARSPGGRTRTEITRDLFRGNKRSDEIEALLDDLVRLGDVGVEHDKPARGRPTTRYFWTGTARDALAALLSGEPGADELNEGTN